MTKSVRDSKLESATVRAKLQPAGKPYYRSIDLGLHLGYRKGSSGGRWVMRRYVGNEKYIVELIGTADDHSPADGLEILSFHQAQTKARKLAAHRRDSSGAETLPFTVSDALDAYLARMDDEHRKTLADSRGRIENHIRPTLGGTLTTDLKTNILAKWLKNLAGQPRRVRGKWGAASRPLEQAKTDDEIRQRRSSANRTLTILKAALNQSFREGKIVTDKEWRNVKAFKEVDSPRIRYFSHDEVRRLVTAAQTDFRDLINAALFTGCRYGELTKLRVGDFNPDAGTVFVAKSKSGKPRHVVLTAEGQAFFRQIAFQRSSDDLMLKKTNGEAWGTSHQLRPMSAACKLAGVDPAGFHIFRHTAASHNVMGGVPLNVVARNLGHADTRMTERHYAHLAPSYVAEMVRKFAPTFGTAEIVPARAIDEVDNEYSRAL